MKKIINILSTLFLLTIVMIGCDEYDRTEVVPTITVDHLSLNMIVGDEVQLTASPDDGSTFNWANENDEIISVSANGLVKALSDGTSDITVSKGGIYTIIPVTVAKLITLESVELNAYSVEVSPGTSQTVIVTANPLDANSTAKNDFSWTSDDTSIAVVTTTAAGDGKITGMRKGTTKVHYKRGDFVHEVEVTVDYTFVFMGPHIISKDAPLTLPAVNFDKGGPGNAYYDTTSGNSGNFAYRANNGDSGSPDVDIESSLGIGYTAAGEWLLYTVEVQDAGVYAFHFELAGNAAGRIRWEVDNETVCTVNTPATGGWSAWSWQFTDNSVEMPLPEGTHKLKFYIEQSNFNLRTFRFTYLRDLD